MSFHTMKEHLHPSVYPLTKAPFHKPCVTLRAFIVTSTVDITLSWYLRARCVVYGC